jgi:ribosomal protein L7/L12
MGDNWTWYLVLAIGIGLLMVMVGNVASAHTRDRARTQRRLTTIERKLDAIVNHLGVVVADDDDEPEVRRLIQQGRRIQAIKLYREKSGADLATAKNAVDDLARKLGLS